MKILAIETSCDDTGVAIVEIKGKKTPSFSILSNLVSSQVKIHAKYGGVYPTLAKREHQKNLPILLKRALKEAGSPKIDLLAVTAGPGLEPCLWTGINFAKDLAKSKKVPLVPVNHIEAHVLANFMNRKTKGLFPAIALIVSGGHTQLILVKGIGKYKLLGETRDDAAGECFDKVARILGLDYPGGPAIAAAAAKFSISNSQFSINLPRPMIYQTNYDFSFSGLKTAVLYDFKSRSSKERKSKDYVQAVAHEVQQAIIDVLIKKTIKAAKNYKVKSVLLAGGVAANKELRKQLKERVKKELPKTKYLAPENYLCTDNALMTAVAGFFQWQSKKTPKESLRDPTGQDWKNIKANANLRV